MLETRCKVKIAFKVNDQEQELEVYPMARLLDVLRGQLRITGPKEGCGEGECGSCSVLVDGQLVNSCLVPAMQVQGKEIHTVEWLASTELGQRLTDAFRVCGGAQCGICTPGMLLAAYSLLKQQPHPSLEDARVGLAGNLCRCTGYTKIFESVLQAAEKGETA